MYFDKKGKSIPVDKWARLFGDFKYKVVKKTKQGDVEVSTVWLGMDHSWSWEGKPEDNPNPIIFETMIFGGKHSDYQTRCSTEEEAFEMHRVAEELAFGKGKK